jgi:hypothetical protein
LENQPEMSNDIMMDIITQSLMNGPVSIHERFKIEIISLVNKLDKYNRKVFIFSMVIAIVRYFFVYFYSVHIFWTLFMF